MVWVRNACLLACPSLSHPCVCRCQRGMLLLQPNSTRPAQEDPFTVLPYLAKSLSRPELAVWEPHPALSPSTDTLFSPMQMESVPYPGFPGDAENNGPFPLEEDDPSVPKYHPLSFSFSFPYLYKPNEGCSILCPFTWE